MVLTSKKQSFMQAKQSSKISEHVPVDASPRSLVGSSTSLSTLFLRPALGVGMSLLYGYYLDNSDYKLIATLNLIWMNPLI